jgi:carotenoid cleavage dioxygenase-like enzyme
MIHDMALTASYVVLVLGPFFFDIAAAMTTGSPMSWQPDQGTRIALIPRDGGPARWLHTEAFWLWHTANAYDTDAPDGTPRVVLDYVQWTAPGGLVHGVTSSGSLARMVLNPATGDVSRETLADHGMEFPRIGDRGLTGPHQIIATGAENERAQGGPQDGVQSEWPRSACTTLSASPRPASCIATVWRNACAWAPRGRGTPARANQRRT